MPQQVRTQSLEVLWSTGYDPKSERSGFNKLGPKVWKSCGQQAMTVSLRDLGLTSQDPKFGSPVVNAMTLSLKGLGLTGQDPKLEVLWSTGYDSKSKSSGFNKLGLVRGSTSYDFFYPSHCMATSIS